MKPILVKVEEPITYEFLESVAQTFYQAGYIDGKRNRDPGDIIWRGEDMPAARVQLYRNGEGTASENKL